jgi:hypothetical protein
MFTTSMTSPTISTAMTRTTKGNVVCLTIIILAVINLFTKCVKLKKFGVIYLIFYSVFCL